MLSFRADFLPRPSPKILSLSPYAPLEVMPMFFRSLTPAEEKKFRRWAHDNYEPGSEIKGTWHPVVQDECVEINRRKAAFVADAANDA